MATDLKIVPRAFAREVFAAIMLEAAYQLVLRRIHEAGARPWSRRKFFATGQSIVAADPSLAAAR